MSIETYDVVIIGGGQAGIPLAWGLAEKGRTVALIERRDLGGSCVNFGCTPTKAAIASAKVAHTARRAHEYGIRIPDVEVDFASVLARARQILMKSRSGLEKGFEGVDNPRLIRAHATLAGRDGAHFRIRAGDRQIAAREVVLNTGTRSMVPPIPGLSDVNFIHAGNWLDSSELPPNLGVLGGGYIALEMGQFYRRIGSEVTIIERSSHVLRREDEDVAAALQQCLEREGIRFLMNTSVESTAKSEGEVRLHLTEDGRAAEPRFSHLFVATGRKPNTDDLGLETIGLSRSKEGFIEVDERLASPVPGVWVAGDIRGGPMFTHTSWDDYRILLSQMAGDGSDTTDRVVPYAVFTDPELGRVGMTEKEARRAGIALKIGRFEFSKNGKANEIGEPDGFIKVLTEEQTGRIAGAAVLHADAAELVHLFIDVMNAGASYTVIRDAVHIHPTLAEAIQSAVAAI